LNDIALQIINDLHSPDILMVQEVENQDICTVSGAALNCGATDNADGKPDVLQELALKIAADGGPAYDAAFDRNSSDLRGIAPAFLYRTDRVQLLPPAGDPILGSSPVIGSYTPVPYDSDVSNPKTLNAVLPAGVSACETSWVFPRAPDVALFRIYSTSIGVGSHRDVYVIDNHFKSGPDAPNKPGLMPPWWQPSRQRIPTRALWLAATSTFTPVLMTPSRPSAKPIQAISSGRSMTPAWD